MPTLKSMLLTTLELAIIALGFGFSAFVMADLAYVPTSF